MKDTKEIDELYARLEDIMGRATRSEVGVSAFLSPRELHFAEAFLRSAGAEFFAYGGYNDAERCRIYVLPEYMAGACDIAGLEEYGYDSGIAAVRVRGSGYEQLTHRAFMGSLLGLGIKRSVVGDIVITDENEAVVLCDSSMVEFLLAHWESVGRDKISLSEVTLGSDFAPTRSYAPINDTVASPRLDCIVAALCSLSREKARETVVSGTVELDYECETRPDREVCPPCLISVRGYGKFRVISVSDKTKKGRYRLIAEKFL